MSKTRHDSVSSSTSSKLPAQTPPVMVSIFGITYQMRHLGSINIHTLFEKVYLRFFIMQIWLEKQKLDKLIGLSL